MTEEEQIQVKTLEDVIEDIKGMNPEYIIEFLKEQIDIIKHGIQYYFYYVLCAFLIAQKTNNMGVFYFFGLGSC